MKDETKEYIIPNLKEYVIPNVKDILHLYNSVGLVNYTSRPEIILNAYMNSLCILTAWVEDELIGVLRIVGDGCTIIYIQDIAVLSEYQRMGIGSMLLASALDKYKGVYQKVLLTDNKPGTKAFYEKRGFTACENFGCISYVMYGC